MRYHRLAPFALITLYAVTSILLTGCTAIGFGIGALADMSSGKRTADRLVAVPVGTNVTVWLHDGRKLYGQFMGSRDSVSDALPSVTAGGGDSSSTVPRTVLLLRTRDGVQQVPIQSVSQVSVPVARGKIIGLLTGLSVDTVLFLLFILALSQSDFS